MDKLQPILQQRFWILLAVCLGLGIFGFFKAQSALVAATEAREQVLRDKTSKISKGEEPNDNYVVQLKEINRQYGGHIQDAVRELFDEQQKLTWWPDSVVARIPKDYRTEIETSPAIIYSKEYPDLIHELWKKVEPVVEKPDMAGPAAGATAARPIGSPMGRSPLGRPGATRPQRAGEPVTWQQKVYCDELDLPQKAFGRVVPWQQVWDAQEDIWFVERVFEAVRAINRNADSPTNAVVRKINRLELRGGSGEVGGEAEAGVESGSSDYANMSRMMMNRGGGDQGGGGGGDFSAAVQFDPAEEFGSDADNSTPEDSDDSPGGLSGMMRGMGAAATLRWIRMEESKPYRERGFYLSVVMQQAQVPEFIIELLNSPWPIRVVRVQMGPNPHYREEAGGTGGGYSMGDSSMAMMRGGSRPTGGDGGALGGGSMSSLAGGRGSQGATGMMQRAAGGGGRGGAMGAAGAGLAFIGSPSDPYAGSLNNPDLVQIDLAGIITFYMPTKEDGTSAVETPAVDSPTLEEAVDADLPAAEDGAVDGEEMPVDPESIEGDAPAADPVDAPTEVPADFVEPAVEDVPDPAFAPDAGPEEPDDAEAALETVEETVP
ncbi:MAG: hypothetical protein KF774_18795 [Planctomyces sp.]|nr:hypothetical protein [Planctomyces sp.]